MGRERATGTATVLFTDLAGSTELMARLGDDRFDAVRIDHFDRLGAVVAAFDGAVVKNTGDGILATFGSTVSALKAAVALQQATRRQAERDGLPLGLRVGLAAGEVSFEGGDVFGTPVVEAARLVASATEGQILCTGLVRGIAGSRAAQVFLELGPAELKGLPDPVVVCEVEWSPADTFPPIHLPSFLTGAGRIFVGRAEYLERLEHRWKEALAGERRLVLLGGEPGVGKTRLATVLAQRLHGDGALVLGGRCDEDLGVPYQPMVEALRHYVSAAAAPRLGRYRGELARLVPELPELVAGLAEPLRSDPDTERYQLFDAVAGWLADVSAERPVLFVVDDLQWGAKPTLLLLRHVLRTAEPLRLLVVATYRDSDVGRGHPLADLMADLPRLEGAERLLLSGLDVPEVASFIEQAAGHELDGDGTDLARVVWRETEGNAFFVVEVLRHLAESGAIEQHEGRWMLQRGLEELGVPQGVRDVVGRRLSRLSDMANRVLACAAVAGLEFEPSVVGAIAGVDEEVVLSALDDAIAARLVVDAPGTAPRNRFSHALVRATLYDELSAGRRVALHRRAAEAIEAIHGRRLDDHLPALAHHWARAAAPAAGAGRAVEYARRAGDRALAQFANDEAAAYYRQALTLLEVADGVLDEPLRLELVLSLGEAQRRAGDPAFRETLHDAAALAERLGDPDALAKAVVANHRGSTYRALGVFDQEQVAALERALELLGPADSPPRARLLSMLALELLFSDERSRRIRLSDEALAMARRLGDPSVLAHIFVNRYWTIGGPDTLAERLANTAELVSISNRLPDPVIRVQGPLVAYRTAFEVGDVAQARRYQDLAEQAAAGIGQPALRFFNTHHAVGHALVAGDVSGAERITAAAMALGESVGDRDAPLFTASQRFWIGYEQGGPREQVEHDLLGAIPDCPRIPLLQVMLALLYCDLGRTEEACSAWDNVASWVCDRLEINHFWPMTVCTGAAVAAPLEDLQRAERLYDMLYPYKAQMVFAMGVSIGSVAHYLGVLASAMRRFDEAAAHFAAAEPAHTRAASPAWLGRTHLEWARMLLVRQKPGDVEAARRHAEEALRHFDALGLDSWSQRVREIAPTGDLPAC